MAIHFLSTFYPFFSNPATIFHAFSLHPSSATQRLKFHTLYFFVKLNRLVHLPNMKFTIIVASLSLILGAAATKVDGVEGRTGLCFRGDFRFIGYCSFPLTGKVVMCATCCSPEKEKEIACTLHNQGHNHHKRIDNIC
ncbi:hypothetical protein GMOD_00006972 [Pyrenophora seminiperda CCB06]|uniref:Uncharacterized protein n=1 Tax=Pyrenophora seminiperda CCB06 TaxID=1302712 RepID=A0A3M7MBU5_9PLEO|nr:hypothetical protein GMOD_00006972 [Pyrenophora seminiperda CCB06]